MNEITDVVTGAFSNSGRYIARRLLAAGRAVRTITGHPERAGIFAGQVASFPYAFDEPARLVAAMEGADTLYNSYWVRFDHGKATYEKAVENTRVLVAAAVKAGVRKIVQVSIANAAADSPFRYYRGKAAIEELVRASGLEYAILKPTVIFGPDGILINNIAWLLRSFPLFMIPGNGRYRIQPVFVDDLAELAVREGRSAGSRELDAVGPETFTYNRLVCVIADAIRRHVPVVHVDRCVTLAASRVLGWPVRDVVLTPEEVDGLMADLLHSKHAPTCPTSFTGWLDANAEQVGRRYLSELATHFDKEVRVG